MFINSKALQITGRDRRVLLKVSEGVVLTEQCPHPCLGASESNVLVASFKMSFILGHSGYRLIHVLSCRHEQLLCIRAHGQE